ncbi:MAG: hypothetical protein HYR64_03735 [Fimbriimonas ginsengisoli]|uniref:GIY-YIG domain-containing protein n=1 Tax=Fimbriimonas ginsengisoli TaxID=1005039 RepID=A0A931LRL8_FIMGI|nr:hypothetical protein [Fimbriimonas ginsengisoli]
MQRPAWVLELSKVLPLTVEAACYEIKRAGSNAASMATLTLAELARQSDLATNGVYLFFKGSDCVYVGKATSRSFIDRIPGHLDWARNRAPNEDGETVIGTWMATLRKKLLRKGQMDSLEFALGLSVLLIPVLSTDGLELLSKCKRLKRCACAGERGDALEIVLLHGMRPCLNDIRTRRPFDAGEILERVLRRMEDAARKNSVACES